MKNNSTHGGLFFDESRYFPIDVGQVGSREALKIHLVEADRQTFHHGVPYDECGRVVGGGETPVMCSLVVAAAKGAMSAPCREFDRTGLSFSTGRKRLEVESHAGENSFRDTRQIVFLLPLTTTSVQLEQGRGLEQEALCSCLWLACWGVGSSRRQTTDVFSQGIVES